MSATFRTRAGPRGMRAWYHCATKRGYAGRHFIQSSARVQFGLDSERRNSTPKAGMSRHEFSNVTDHLRVLSVRVIRPASSGVQVSIPGEVSSASKAASRKRPRVYFVRGYQHRTPRDRSEELAQQPEALWVSARRARLANARCSNSTAGSMCFACWIHAPSVTPGGAISARPMRTTSVGGSTIRLRRRASPNARELRISTWANVSPIMRH